MRTYDFINANIGAEVYITGDRDYAMSYRTFIHYKTPLKLVRLTKGGMAILEKEGAIYEVRPSNVRLYSELLTNL